MSPCCQTCMNHPWGPVPRVNPRLRPQERHGLSRQKFILAWILLAILAAPIGVGASLEAYDLAVQQDSSLGLNPTALLTNAVLFTGSNRASFNFGPTSGDATIEFILEGDPVAGSASKYLAVGANATSNLRYEQWNNSGQLGFTQLGVLDYLFSPTVPSPTIPVHIAYMTAWVDREGIIQFRRDIYNRDPALQQ